MMFKQLKAGEPFAAHGAEYVKIGRCCAVKVVSASVYFDPDEYVSRSAVPLPQVPHRRHKETTE